MRFVRRARAGARGESMRAGKLDRPVIVSAAACWLAQERKQQATDAVQAARVGASIVKDDALLKRIATARHSAHRMPRRVWRIDGYDGSRHIFRKDVTFGSLSEREMINLLKRLASKHLTEDEIVAASIRANAPGHAPLLENRVRTSDKGAQSYAITVGSNPHYTAIVIERNTKTD